MHYSAKLGGNWNFFRWDGSLIRVKKIKLVRMGILKNGWNYYRTVTVRLRSLKSALRTKMTRRTGLKNSAMMDVSSNREISKVLGLLVFEWVIDTPGCHEKRLCIDAQSLLCLTFEFHAVPRPEPHQTWASPGQRLRVQSRTQSRSHRDASRGRVPDTT